MNRMRRLGGLTATALLMIAGAASAQTTSNPALPNAAQTGPARALRADIDHDGRLSKVEFVQARLAPLVAMDADRDGTVTIAERTATHQARTAARATQRFDRLDTDKDGKISRAEFEAVGQGRRASRQAGREGGRRAGPAGHRMRPARRGAHRMGADRSGAASPIVIAEVRARAEATFDRLDTDRDGFLVQAERQAARTAARAAVRSVGGERRQGHRIAAGTARAGDGTMTPDTDREARRDARREARRLRMENVAPASPATPASE